jgi:hypothetical protein
MTCEESKIRLADYWRAGADSQDAELERHLATCAACGADARDLGLLWEALGELPEDEPRMRVSHKFYSRLRDMERADMRRAALFNWLRTPWITAAAACAILAAGVALGRYSAQRDNEISRLQDQIANMRQMVALSLLGQQSASERLKGIDYAQGLHDNDNKVVQALLTAMEQDSNVNVRLAAVDALRRYGELSEVRRSLINTLPRQDSPLMQIAVMDQLVEMRDRSSVPAISALLNERDLNPAVRHHAAWALQQLQEQ